MQETLYMQEFLLSAVRVNKILTTAPDDLSFTDSHGNICRRNVSAYKKKT